jgi:ubiquinol-cytochrome c reductase cytochrome b subunit
MALITETKWGAKSLVSLYVSVLTGMVVALQYEPTTPFFSVGSTDLLVPFGAFWRSSHFYSSQLFFLFSLMHLWAVLLDKKDDMAVNKWLLLIISLPAALLLLFTGYVLRADATGEAAGLIAENITLSIPILGKWLNSLLFAIEAEGMKRVYANHLIGLGVLWGICCWDHLRRYRVQLKQHGLLVGGMLVFSLLTMAPMEPWRNGVFHIQGPWFFLGLQEVLRYVHPFWAGVVFPGTVIIALGLVPVKTHWRKPILSFVAIWLGLYGVLSVISALR